MLAKRLAAATLLVVATISLSTAIVDGGFWDSPKNQVGTSTLAVSDVAGFTKIGFTADHVVVINVLPGEEMFSPTQVSNEHPIAGELALEGVGTDLTVDSRHVEAHIYDRVTGLPITSIVPTIEVTNRTSGEVFIVNPVRMQDVVTGAPDVHFGDNIAIPGASDLTVRVRLAEGEEVVVNGHLN